MNLLHEQMVEHWSKHNSLIHKYWNDVNLIAGSRKLAGIIQKYNPSSVFEVGCYNCRNLYYIKELMPDIKLGGIDVNETALKSAVDYLPDADLILGDAAKMDTEEKYDVVFTHGVLMHIPKLTMKQVINHCIAKATVAIIHVERPELDDKKIGSKRHEFRWRPDVGKVYKQLGYNPIVRIEKVGGVKRKSSITIVELNK